MKNKVCILLSTYNGEKFLESQIKSIFSQSYKNIDIIVRDDGSTDNTLKILEKYKIKYIKGKNISVVKSFFKLLEYALELDYEYFLFCDQDDIWNINKVEKQLSLIELKNKNIPILIDSDMQVIDENNNLISNSFFKFSKLDYRKKSLNYLFVQNNITGNSVLINRKLAQLVKFHKNIIMHDWWIGLIASAFGEIYFINQPLLKYRKHFSNVVGAEHYYSLNKIRKFFDYSFEKKFLQVEAFKELYYNNLDKKNKSLIDDFLKLRHQKFFEKFYNIFKNKFFMQNNLYTLGSLWKI